MRARSVFFATVFAVLVTAGAAHATGPVVSPNGTMSWTQPNVNGDGTPTTDFGGFEVMVSGSPGTPAAVLGKPCPTTGGVTCYNVGALGVPAAPPAPASVSTSLATLAGIANGQRYACVRAYDAAGNRTPCSNEVPFVYDGAAPGTPSGYTVTP